MTKEQIEELMQNNVCPKCLEQQKREDPGMLDCKLRYTRYAHLCHKAEKYNKKGRKGKR